MNHIVRHQQEGADSERRTKTIIGVLQAILALTVVAEVLSGELLLAAEALLALALCSLVVHLPQVPGGPSMLEIEAVLLLIVIGNCTLGVALHLYKLLPYFDKLLHLVNPAVLAYYSLLFLQAILKPGGTRLSTVTLVVMSVLLVLGTGTVWEILEYLSDTVLRTATQGSPGMSPLDDTMWDSMLGLLGASTGGWVASRVLAGQGWARPRARENSWR